MIKCPRCLTLVENEHSPDSKECSDNCITRYRKQIEILKIALEDIVGASEQEELEKMEIVLRTIPAPANDTIISINAIHALLSLREE